MAAPPSYREGRWCVMGTYEILSLLFWAARSLSHYWTYIDRHNKIKKCHHPVSQQDRRVLSM